MKLFYTVPELAEITGEPEGTWYWRVSHNKIKHVRWGGRIAIKAGAFQSWLNKKAREEAQ